MNRRKLLYLFHRLVGAEKWRYIVPTIDHTSTWMSRGMAMELARSSIRNGRPAYVVYFPEAKNPRPAEPKEHWI